MVIPSLMAAHWVGQNSGHICRRLWIEVHQIKFACAGVSIVYKSHFPIDNVLLHSADIHDQVMKLSEIVPKF